MSLNVNSGCYILIIPVNKRRSVAVGALGTIHFNEGQYVYVGRAKRNLMQRIERHFRKEKKLRWHIDYLLQYYSVGSAFITPSLDECIIAQKVAEVSDVEVIDRFGASDCKCKSHLMYFNTESGLNDLHVMLEQNLKSEFQKVDIRR